MRGAGTLINLVTVAAGAGLGMLLGDRLPERARTTIMQGLGLVTLAVGVAGLQPLLEQGQSLRRFVVLIAAVVGGGLVGEALRLQERLDGAGESLRRALGGLGTRRQSHGRFVEGFVVASTVFCAGPLTILGSIEDGLGVSVRSLAIKSALDFFASIGFASVYGAGVLASLVTILLFQGGITAAAALVAPMMTPEVTAMLGASGALLVLGIGLRLLELAPVRVVSLLPALVLGPALGQLSLALFP